MIETRGYTASSYINGPAGDADIARMGAEAGGVPAMTTTDAAVRCLRSVGARRLRLAPPYPEEPTRSAADLLTSRGREDPGSSRSSGRGSRIDPVGS